jgi:hypothetical protein
LPAAAFRRPFGDSPAECRLWSLAILRQPLADESAGIGGFSVTTILFSISFFFKTAGSGGFAAFSLT